LNDATPPVIRTTNRIGFGLILGLILALCWTADPLGRSAMAAGAGAPSQAVEIEPSTPPQEPPPQASAAPAPASLPSPAEIEDLIVTLENQTRRQALIEQLRTLNAAQKTIARSEADEPSPLAEGLEALAAGLDEVSGKFSLVGQELRNVDSLMQWLTAQWTEPETRSQWLAALITVGTAFAAGFAAEWLGRRALYPIERRLFDRQVKNPIVRLVWSVLQFLMALAPIAGFVATGYAILAFAEPAPAAKLAGLTLINAVVIARALTRAGQAFLQPQFAGIRPLPIGNETAAYLDIWIKRFSVVVIYGYFGVEALQLFGLPKGGYLLLSNLVGLVAALLPVVFILQNRQPVANWLRGDGAADTVVRHWRRRFADVWHVPAIGYVLATYLFWTLSFSGGFVFLVRGSIVSIAIVMLAKLLARGMTLGLEAAFALSRDLRARHPALETRANRYLALLGAAARMLIYLAALFAVLAAWGVDSRAWLARVAQSNFGDSLFSIVLTGFGALLVWDFAGYLMERQIARRGAGSGSQARKAARLRTFLPIFQRFLMGALAVIVGMVALSELGVDIAPLLAGAGIIGIAVGLGAQTLAKDVLTSVSHVMEDTFAVGDMVEVAGHKGIVEKISMRAIRLRVGEGVITIPFSEVSSVTNLTFALLDIGVSYDTDIEKAMAVMEKVAVELRQDPAFSSWILSDLEIFGVSSFNDSSISILGRIKAIPGKQARVANGYRKRLKPAFDAAGIEIPFPQHTVHLATPAKA
jgi:small conductance mechanosensitive channel